VHWGADPDEEIWLDEGLSGYAEEVAGFPEADADAVPEFLRRPDTSLTDWNFNSPARSYGATYLFASYLAERYGPDLIRAVVAETRNGVAGVDRALAQAGSPDRFVDAWAGWIAGNYASSDAALRYAATAGRRVTTFSYETLPLEGLTGNVTGAWGTLNLLFRTPGSLAIDFDGDDGTGFRLWTYAMSGGAGQLAELALSGDNRGHAQAAPIDSLLLIVGRTSPQGGDFELSVRASTPTAVTGPLAAGPDGPTLVSPYPNPFNAQVRIPYVLDEAASVEVTVHALNGQRVRGLVEADRHPGRHEALWDGRDDDGAAVASGAYLVRLRAASSVDLTRVALVR
jgi:hypothetical protein